MLNTMVENKNTGFANNLIPFLRTCSQYFTAVNMTSGKGSKY